VYAKVNKIVFSQQGNKFGVGAQTVLHVQYSVNSQKFIAKSHPTIQCCGSGTGFGRIGIIEADPDRDPDPVSSNPLDPDPNLGQCLFQLDVKLN
jgi:hypothetical protein